MKNFKTLFKVLAIFVITAIISTALVLFCYLKLLPYMISNEKSISYVENILNKVTNSEIKIESPEIITKLAPNIVFKIRKININKNNKELLLVENLDTMVSLKRVFKKQIILKHFNVDELYIDTNELISLLPGTKQNSESKKNDWSIQWLDSLLSLKDCTILYKTSPDTQIKLQGRNMVVSQAREPKAVRFNLIIDIIKDNNNIKITLEDKNSVFIKNHKLVIDKADLNVNNSRMFIDATADEKNNFNLNIYSPKFDIKNIVGLLKTNMLIPNGNEMMSFFQDIHGNFDFDIRIDNKNINGNINSHNVRFKVIPVANLPVSVNRGSIKIDNDKISLNDFSGVYGTSLYNKFLLNGDIKDYTNSVDTNIEVTGVATNNLTENYLSKLIGAKLTVTGAANIKAIIKSKFNKIDLIAMFKIPKGNNVFLEGISLSPDLYDKALYSHFTLEKDILNIESIQYYLASELNKATKNIEPILTIDGQANINTQKVHRIGFDFPKPLTSEFLNIFAGGKIFKNGQIEGKMDIVFDDNIPKMQGDLLMTNVFIPSQRLSIKNAILSTDAKLIKINANGKFKRSDYKFSGIINNALVFPIVVKDINLSIDSIDIEKLIISMSKQPSSINSQPITSQAFVSNGVNSYDEDDSYIFNTKLLIVEKCILNIVKGIYKDIQFGNLLANLTLNKEGVLEIKSNKFNFAEGVSSLRVLCDLVNQKYSIRLGAKDINADLLASNILNLSKEISGRATGLIELNTDKTLKLNGRILFDIQNGTIQKAGLVQYVLNFASLFRNPMAMLSPSTIIDIVNIPNGEFEKINGKLFIKDNIVENMMIKSSAPQLSAFIVGWYDLGINDASLRIYTKFSGKNKGFTGFLRNISLNSLANKMSMGNNSDSDANYYALELAQIPKLDDEKGCQIFLTKIEGDVVNFNFLSSLKKIK